MEHFVRMLATPYTGRNKRLILDSRTHATTALGEAIRQAANPPGLWVNLASATVYRHSSDQTMGELTGETGSPQPAARSQRTASRNRFARRGNGHSGMPTRPKPAG